MHPIFKTQISILLWIQKTVYSKLRQKTDASSVYLKCKSSSREGGTYNAKVYAAKTETSKKDDLSAGHTYKVGAGQTKRMINKVNEKGYLYACIQATRNYMYSSIFKNVWSPDSV